MSDIILKISQLSKTFPNGVQALKNVSFEVKRGEFLVVIGLSGSGKSTLLRCINQLHQPSSGQILFNGQDITYLEGRKARELRTKIAMIFQQFNLIGRKSVLNNVLMGRLSKTNTLKSLFDLFSEKDVAQSKEYLKLVGIEQKAFIRANQLSGGQQQRVAIARALNQKPEMLLADEPVASLDPATCHTVMDYLEKVNKELGITIVCNLHFLSLVRQYATRVIALKGGELVYDGSPNDISDTWFQTIYGEKAREVHIN
ncbi:MAG: phosphonate ABC transporter ATP-binding protein [Bdellovibrionales bacterium CG10_big_fil_rev_8_21_14_0_10_45_34]|nr:MAG: phosphonate ABC transporter ATP-binding protein [Bdellovibrionales bacterium CG10_big_fil_rev_8_21_14_0_10_45_34]